MSEWNPKDPEALTTRYDLADWSVDDRADVAAALADAEVATHGMAQSCWWHKTPSR